MHLFFGHCLDSGGVEYFFSNLCHIHWDDTFGNCALHYQRDPFVLERYTNDSWTKGRDTSKPISGWILTIRVTMH